MKCDRCDYPDANEEPLTETLVRVTCPRCGLDIAKPVTRASDPCKIPDEEQKQRH